MKNFINTLSNIWSIKELKDRILYTLLLIAVFRFGSFVVLPGINANVLSEVGNGRNPNDILGLINSFTGGAFNQGSVFALGIMPYITASIIVQLLGFVVPYFQKLQQYEGQSGRNTLNQITRWLTLAITFVQGAAYLGLITSKGAVSSEISPAVFYFSGLIILTAGTIFTMWLGERITENGIGNGVSFIIMAGIIATLPRVFFAEVTGQLSIGGPIVLLLELILLFGVFLATILLTQGVRRIPIQFAKRMVGRSMDNNNLGGMQDSIPIKVNGVGVMPIIFAQALMFIPASVGSFLVGNGSGDSILNVLSDWKSWQYNLIFFLLVVLFTYVYTALIINPRQYSEYLKRQNAFIHGIKPGEDTESYIDDITSKITLPGAVFLGLIAIFPKVASILGVNDGFAIFFGGTSLIIIVGVVLDTLQQIESYLLMKKYDGLIKSGKVKGRSGVVEV